MDNTNILLRRHSVRDFMDKEIDVDLLKQIIFDTKELLRMKIVNLGKLTSLQEKL